MNPKTGRFAMGRRRVGGHAGGASRQAHHSRRWIIGMTAAFVFYFQFCAFGGGGPAHGDDGYGFATTAAMSAPSTPGLASRNGTGGMDREGLTEIPPYGCSPIYAKRKMQKDGSLTGIRMLNVSSPRYIARFGRGVHYAHMAMIERVTGVPGARDGERLVAAWQAAPKAPRYAESDGSGPFQTVAVEGLPRQRIYWAVSDDGGGSWSAPAMIEADRDAHDAAYWSPVLFFDPKASTLWLFYSVSTRCKKIMHDTALWEPGGDIRARAMRTHGNGGLAAAASTGAGGGRGGEGSSSSSSSSSSAGGGGGKGMGFASSMGLGALGMTPAWQWGRPKTLLKQSTDGIPKVIANKPIALSNGDWVMPFWREQPNEANNGTCTQQAKEAKEGKEGREGGEGRGEGRGREGKGKPKKVVRDEFMYEHIANRTSAGVLVSSDRGRSWRPYGNIREPRTNLIEGTVVEIGEEVHMYFRAIVGCVFRSISKDRGRTWQRPEPLALANPNTKMSVVAVQPPPSGEGEGREGREGSEDARDAGDAMVGVGVEVGKKGKEGKEGKGRKERPPVLVMAFNNHKRGMPGCTNCRTHLHIGASVDGGNTWSQVRLLPPTPSPHTPPPTYRHSHPLPTTRTRTRTL